MTSLIDLTKVQRQFKEIGIVFSTHGIGIIGYLRQGEFENASQHFLSLLSLMFTPCIILGTANMTPRLRLHCMEQLTLKQGYYLRSVYISLSTNREFSLPGYRRGIQRFTRTQEGFGALLLLEDGSKEFKECGQALAPENIPNIKKGVIGIQL